MEIKSIKRPWIKNTSQGATYTDTSFYSTSTWRSLRARKLQMSPYCECPECVGKKVPARVVDHIKPITLGGAALDMNNLQSMADKCHNKKRAREKNAKYSKK